MAKRMTKAKRAEIVEAARKAAHQACVDNYTAADTSMCAKHACPYVEYHHPAQHAAFMKAFTDEMFAIFGETEQESAQRYDLEFAASTRRTA